MTKSTYVVCAALLTGLFGLADRVLAADSPSLAGVAYATDSRPQPAWPTLRILLPAAGRPTLRILPAWPAWLTLRIRQSRRRSAARGTEGHQYPATPATPTRSSQPPMTAPESRLRPTIQSVNGKDKRKAVDRMFLEPSVFSEDGLSACQRHVPGAGPLHHSNRSSQSNLPVGNRSGYLNNMLSGITTTGELAKLGRDD